MNDVVSLPAPAETEAEPEWTDWEPRGVKANNAKEAEARRPTVKKLGPAPGTVVDVELRPADDSGAEPLAARNRLDKYGNLYLKAPARIADGWPEMPSEAGYVARYRVLPADAIAAPRPTRATRAEVDQLRAELAAERDRAKILQGELEEARQLLAAFDTAAD
jgi:hypothetical protein